MRIRSWKLKAHKVKLEIKHNLNSEDDKMITHWNIVEMEMENYAFLNILNLRLDVLANHKLFYLNKWVKEIVNNIQEFRLM